MPVIPISQTNYNRCNIFILAINSHYAIDKSSLGYFLLLSVNVMSKFMNIWVIPLRILNIKLCSLNYNVNRLQVSLSGWFFWKQRFSVTRNGSSSILLIYMEISAVSLFTWNRLFVRFVYLQIICFYGPRHTFIFRIWEEIRMSCISVNYLEILINVWQMFPFLKRERLFQWLEMRYDQIPRLCGHVGDRSG